MRKRRQAQERNVTGKRIREARLKCQPPVSQDDLAGKMAARGIVLAAARVRDFSLLQECGVCKILAVMRG